MNFEGISKRKYVKEENVKVRSYYYSACTENSINGPLGGLVIC